MVKGCERHFLVGMAGVSLVPYVWTVSSAWEVWGFDQFRFPNDIAAVFVPYPEADRQWHPRLHLLFASWCTTCQFTGHGTGGCSTEGTRCLEEDERAGELRWKQMKTNPNKPIWMFPKIGVPPKWMVYNGKPYYNGWFGGTIIFGNTHMCFTLWSGLVGVIVYSNFRL